MTHSRVQRRLAAILAGDVVGYSRLMRADEVGTRARVRGLFDEVLGPAVADHGGRLIKTTGDGVLVEFASAVDAVQCAVRVQGEAAARNAGLVDGDRLDLRIGINLGDVIVEEGDLFGDGVNVAARLEGLAAPGGICVSDSVYQQVRRKLDPGFEDMGAQALKNIDEPVRVWRIGAGATAPAAGRRAATPPEPGLPSIAVLPFTAMSADPEQEFFADGLVEDIITTLSKLAGLRVIARNSTFVYKGKAVDVREAARQLGVQFVLEGSVRRGGNRIRITAQLIDAASGSHLWAERYDRAVDDIFAVQDEITLVLATEMQVKLTEGEQARLRYTTTDNIDAWTHWVRGLSHFRKPVTKENCAAALACWTRALALDPGSAMLNAMVGFLHCVDARFGWWDERQTALAKARDFADRALARDPDSADAHVTAGMTALLQRRFDEAAIHARRAADLAPGSADAVSLACFTLAFAGHPGEAVAHGERALTLSPNYPPYYLGHLGNAYRLAGKTEEAIGTFKAFHARAPGFGLVDLVLVYQQGSRGADAARTARELVSIRRDFTIGAWAQTQIRADAAGLEADIAALRAAGLPE